MKTFFLVLVLILSACKADKKNNKVVNDNYVVELDVYNFKELKPILTKQDDKVYVINFWATWCAPCVKELPYFESLNSEFESKGVEVVLVSLDFPNQYEKRLIPFIEKYKLQSKVIALNDVDSNNWIPKISRDWSGAIPATVIYNKEKRKFYEQSFTYKELKTEVNKFLNK